jgi:hypothetical protein
MAFDRPNLGPHCLSHADEALGLDPQRFIQRGMEQCGLRDEAHGRFEMRHRLAQEHRRVFRFG